ncbi:multisubunit potassium/proton antiporter, PhaG subunit [Loktanella fryxellensis]|uniref:Multisubunit potassium/proton antiporter, PhaG subunit n=1 Tax=Loktanella fryxellensis TaxID=245187 RepID=A0A1H8EFQ9_9RHOB|nr:monovalent cation/H(+) antiporter subunit G [Loktanella fryxellensis]SEN17588.1 multisubunit potassium/proton antiporter, PhaG subunit [Loktanella fryxellensis]
MTWAPLIVDILTTVLLLTGATLMLAGSFGLLKLSNPMSRIHAPTLASTLGIGCLLLASILYNLGQGTPSLREVLVMAFLLVTTPISGHFIGRVHLHRYRADAKFDPPPSDIVWATRAENDDAPSSID